jgi:C1A family cysteine protease
MMSRKLAVLCFLVVGLILIGVMSISSAEKPERSFQMQRLNALESLEISGKIPPVPQQFKNYIVQPQSIDGSYGLVPPMYDYPVTQPLVRNEELPALWDWRDHDGVSPVGNQGNTGTCWVWGALKGFEANIKVASGDYYDFAERTIVNCAKWVDDLPISERGGLAIMVAHWLSTKGATWEVDDPWGPPWDECLYDQLTPVMGSYGWTRLPADIDTIKSYLYRYGPIQTSMYANFLPGGYDGSYALYCTGNHNSNHSVQIVGWDDNMPYPYGQGVWICQNSWGTGWGDGGYFYIAYDLNYSANIGKTGGFYASYHTWPLPQMRGTLYYYDEIGPSTWVTDGGSPDPSIYWGAVIYEATNWGRLAYIETWIPDGNTGVESFVYRGFTTSGSPNGPRRLLRQQPGFCVLTGGFKRLSITGRPLYVRPGDTFVVVTRIDCDTYQYPLPVEYCFDGTDCTQETGKCWESQDGQPGSWYDCSTWDYDLSIRARAMNLTPMDVKLDPATSVVLIGHEYDICWAYPPDTWAARRYANNEELTIELVRFDDIDRVGATIVEKIKPTIEKFHWKVDKNYYLITPDAVEPRYCVRITNGRVIGLSEPFYIRKP